MIYFSFLVDTGLSEEILHDFTQEWHKTSDVKRTKQSKQQQKNKQI